MGVKRGDIMATIWINFTLHAENKFAEFEKYHIERIIICCCCIPSPMNFASKGSRIFR